MGTPGFMAPEQLDDAKRADGRADLYAVGVILYEALTGQRPFEADNYNALMVAIASSETSPPSLLRQGLPGELEEVILRAMAREPEDRFERASQFLEALAFGRRPRLQLSHVRAPGAACLFHH